MPPLERGGERVGGFVDRLGGFEDLLGRSLGAVDDGVELAAGATSAGLAEGAEVKARQLLLGAADGAMDIVGLALEALEFADRHELDIERGRAAATLDRRCGRRALLDEVAQRLQFVEHFMMLGRGAGRVARRAARGGRHLLDAESLLPHRHRGDLAPLCFWRVLAQVPEKWIPVIL